MVSKKKICVFSTMVTAAVWLASRRGSGTSRRLLRSTHEEGAWRAFDGRGLRSVPRLYSVSTGSGNSSTTTGSYTYWTLGQLCVSVPEELAEAHTNPIVALLTVLLACLSFAVSARLYQSTSYYEAKAKGKAEKAVIKRLGAKAAMVPEEVDGLDDGVGGRCGAPAG